MDSNILHNISYGMYVVGSFRGDSVNAQIANTLFQVTSEPVTIAVSINRENLTYEFIEESLRFSVSVLSEEAPLNFIGNFGFKSGRTADKFKDVKFKKLSSGCPVVLDYSIGYLDLKVVNKLDCTTHTLFIGEMVDSQILKSGRPMTYDYYHQVKRGTTPKAAPTFIKGEGIMAGGAKMQKYRCTVCNYIYDPAVGDPDGGVQPGTLFKDIPDNWVCPVCGVGKDKFVKEG